MNIKNYIAYIKHVLKHKVLVFQECVKLGIPWRGITHDLSKFSPAEFGPYMRRHSYLYTRKDATNDSFNKAVHHHYQRNHHHWEYWTISVSEAVQMPHKDMLEMVADWRAMSMQHGESARKWYEEMKMMSLITLHDETRRHVEELLGL